LIMKTGWLNCTTNLVDQTSRFFIPEILFWTDVTF
jgi:hypothetical protein